MERLKLVCGRYMPPRVGDTAQRVERMEAYLAKLTQELELLIRDVDGILAEMGTEGVDPAVMSHGGEEEQA